MTLNVIVWVITLKMQLCFIFKDFVSWLHLVIGNPLHVNLIFSDSLLIKLMFCKTRRMLILGGLLTGWTFWFPSRWAYNHLLCFKVYNFEESKLRENTWASTLLNNERTSRCWQHVSVFTSQLKFASGPESMDTLVPYPVRHSLIRTWCWPFWYSFFFFNGDNFKSSASFSGAVYSMRKYDMCSFILPKGRYILGLWKRRSTLTVVTHFVLKC